MKLRLSFEQKKSARWGRFLFRALARELLLFKFYMLTYNRIIFAKEHFFLFLLWIAARSVEETGARSAY